MGGVQGTGQVVGAVRHGLLFHGSTSCPLWSWSPEALPFSALPLSGLSSLLGPSPPAMDFQGLSRATSLKEARPEPWREVVAEMSLTRALSPHVPGGGDFIY